MKRLTLFIVLVFVVIFAVGCGGGGKKINGVADEEGQVMAEGQEAAGENLPTTYEVQDGDKLWTIAEKADIYGNKWQWPLIYDANRDKIENYNDALEEGDKLIIPRNVSAVEIEAAKERAMELGIPPGSKAAGGVSEEEASSEETSAGGDEGTTEAAGGTTESGTTDLGVDQQPTPIPQAPAAKKKGSPVWIIIILLLLVGGAVAVIFFMQKKKEEEEEQSQAKDDTSSGSGGGLLQ